MQQHKLSRRGWLAVEDRLRHLEEERIPALERDARETGDPSVAVSLGEAREEVLRLREVLVSATALEDEPHDPSIAEVGDTVTIRTEGASATQRFTIVAPVEARVSDTWISSESPLGSALLGAREGDEVEVQAPGGRTRYEVLAIERRA